MNAISNAALRQIRIANDNAKREAAPAQDWPSTVRAPISETGVERFIADVVAANGTYEDVFGMPVRAQSLYLAVAQQWVKDEASLGEIIGPVFWKWAKGAADTAGYK